MKRSNLVFLTLLILFPAVNISGQLPFRMTRNYPSASSTDTLRILALMVEFQSDNDKTTYGTGKFSSVYTKNYGNEILDPLPHDSGYFAAHLEFAKNYFRKNSRGKQEIEYTVLPQIVTVSQTMRNYSPPIKSTDFKPIVDFSIEAWKEADSLYTGFDFSKYNLFMIFHAGVGRDISVPGSLGNERDIPSIFMNIDLFRQYYGNSFAGIPVNNGTQLITNTAVLPQTQNREVELLTGSALYEITINGLLVATIGSRLGLPDLFNTETGLSAIGRFGLMDGQSIFAYNGLFPPELSAWEKVYLGWETPVTLTGSSSVLSLTSVLASGASDTVLLKIPINSSEYFLLENRQRDAQANGSRLTMKKGGNVITKVFSNDTTGYYSYSTDSIDGVLLDVDEFDWSLPGSGVLIWHINENVINAKKSENKINADKNNRGVDLEEADGIQDIGEQFTTIFGDLITAEGNEEDFWFASNPAELFKNKFDGASRPNSNSASGAASLIKLSDLSYNGNRIYFRVSNGTDVVKPIAAKQVSLGGELLHLSPVVFLSKNLFQIHSANKTFLTDDSVNVKASLSLFSSFTSPSVTLNNSLYLFGAKQNTINVAIYNNDSTSQMSFSLDSDVNCPMVIQESASELSKVIAGTKGKVLRFQINPSANPLLQKIDSVALSPSDSIMQIAASESYYCFAYKTAGSNLFTVRDNEGNSLSIEGEFKKLALYKTTGTDFRICILSGDNIICILEKGKVIDSFPLRSSVPVDDFYLTNPNNDNKLLINYTSGSFFYSMNLYGGMAENFPHRDETGPQFTNAMLSADISAEYGSSLFYFRDSRDFGAVNSSSGSPVTNFPLAFNQNSILRAAISSSSSKKVLVLLDGAGNMNTYEILYPGAAVNWSGKYKDQFNSSFVNVAGSVIPGSDFMPSNSTYNYPNPVYSGSTYIRYLVNEDSRINIRIYDLAGDLVKEINDYAAANYECETAWDINNIQSGVYFANVTATGNSGKKATKIIKIAVIR